jgi:hypothetical protein
MKNKRSYFTVWLLTMTLLLASALWPSEPDAAAQDAPAVAQTGLLPIYGVDFNFDPAWVDGEKFPSQSEKFPHFGVNPAFQQVWEALKPLGFNALRFAIDVRDAKKAARRVANLCLWASQNNVKLLPVLVGAERNHSLGDGFASDTADFSKALLKTLRSEDGQYLAAYPQILAFQLEHQMNHAGLHDAMERVKAQKRLAEAARELRRTEEQVLAGSGLSPTPLLVNASFDYELVSARALAGAPLSEEAYAQAVGALHEFLKTFADTLEVDLIGVDWFPGSLSAGRVEQLPEVARQVMEALPGKQVVFTTGMSASFHTPDEQRQFYALAFANLADLRGSLGADAPFAGVFFHEALNGLEPKPAPDLERALMSRERAAQADELLRLWRGEGDSKMMAWWWQKVENSLGLLTLARNRAGDIALQAQPPLESLQQVAATVDEANAALADANAIPEASPAEGEAVATDSPDAGESGSPAETPAKDAPKSSMKRALKERAQQATLLLLDYFMERLSRRLNRGQGGDSGGNNAGNYGNNPGGNAPAVALELTRANVTWSPANPRLGEPAVFNIGLRNRSDADANGLVVAVTDEATGLLAQQTDVAVARRSAQTVTLTWTPAAEGSYKPVVQVYDAAYSNQFIAPVALGALTITAGNAAGASGGGTRPVPPRVFQPAGGPQMRGLRISAGGQTALRAGQPAVVEVTVANPYARSFSNVTARLLINNKETQTRSLGTLLPQQSRAVAFGNVLFPQAGAQEVKVLLESVGAKRLTATLAQRAQVLGVTTPPPPTSTKPVSGGNKPGSRPIGTTRPIGSDRIIGGVSLPTEPKKTPTPGVGRPPTPAPTRSPRPSFTPMPGPTRPPMPPPPVPTRPPRPTVTPSPAPTRPPRPAVTPIPVPTRPPTPAPTRPPRPTVTPSPAPTRPPRPAVTPIPVPTRTPLRPTPTPTPSRRPPVTPTPRPTSTPRVTPSPTPRRIIIPTPTPRPTPRPTPHPTLRPNFTASNNALQRAPVTAYRAVSAGPSRRETVSVGARFEPFASTKGKSDEKHNCNPCHSDDALPRYFVRHPPAVSATERRVRAAPDFRYPARSRARTVGRRAADGRRAECQSP